MNPKKQQGINDQAPWWGIAILYLMLTPIVVLAFLAFKFLILIWHDFDGSVGSGYAVSVFAIIACLLFAYVIMIVRQIYVEFIAPKLVARSKRRRRQ